jgi:hypothetical protein
VTKTLAMIGTPVQWLFIATVGVLLFAPRLIPVIGRILGRMVRSEVRRRYGVTLKPAPRSPVQRAATIESIPAPEPAPGAPAPVEPRDEPAPLTQSHATAPRAPGAPVWGVAALVAGAAAVLLWILLHGR